jgi:hypothetical protein
MVWPSTYAHRERERERDLGQSSRALLETRPRGTKHVSDQSLQAATTVRYEMMLEIPHHPSRRPAYRSFIYVGTKHETSHTTRSCHVRW